MRVDRVLCKLEVYYTLDNPIMCHQKRLNLKPSQLCFLQSNLCKLQLRVCLVSVDGMIPIRTVVILCVFAVICVYCSYYFDAGLLVRSQYSEGRATGHLDTGFSWFLCAQKQMLRWFLTFQIATTCSSCSPPELNLLVKKFIFCIHAK